MSFGIDVAVIQKTHFVCDIDAHVLSSDFVVYSAYGDQLARSVSWLVKCSLGVRVDLVHVNVGNQLIMANISMKSSLFRIVVIYVPNNQGECVDFPG